MAFSFDGKADIYSLLQQQIDTAFDISEVEDDANDGLEGRAYRFELTKTYLKDNKHNLFIGFSYALVLIHCIFLIFSLLKAFMSLDTSYLAGNFPVLIISSVLPFFIWAYSSQYEYWTFHNRKIFCLEFCIFHFVLNLTNLLMRIVSLLVIPMCAAMQPAGGVTISMIRNLARLFLLVLSLVPPLAFFAILVHSFSDPLNKTRIINFKFNKLYDTRSKNEKEFAYDMSIVKNLTTGETHTIKEKDRYLHSVANGTTGTGKTSSCFTCAINSDIEQISHNLEYQKKKIQEYLSAGRVRMIGPMNDSDFSLDNFEPVNPKDKNLITDLKFTAKLAGITAMAPNASFSDEIYVLAKAKGLKVNRLDPTLDANGKLKEGFVGFNPLYISPDLDQLQWVIEVNKKAVLFADVAQAVYDATGSSDVYFASLNKNITTTVTTLVLLTYPFMENSMGKQPTPLQVQDVLNDFTKAVPYKDKLVALYAKKDVNGNIVNKMHPDLGMFQPIYDVVMYDLIGEGRAQLFDQCRGLRNIINSFLQNPMIRNILCTDKSIDLDKCLADGEITLVNYALELGSDSTVFGLFFLLSFINAVLRRPGTEKTRIPNFFYIDELPVLLHPRIESCFSLFRQYRTAMFVAIQSLSQMDKSSATAFLKPVLMGNCAHHFVFGRVATDEMKMYQELAGTSLQLVEQIGETETSLLADNPSASFNKRYTPQQANNIEGGDIRYRDFQEVTVLTVDNGSPVAAFFGRVSFLPGYRRIKKKRYAVDWNEKYLDSVEESPKSDSNDETTKQPPSGFTFSSGTSIPKETIADDRYHFETAHTLEDSDADDFLSLDEEPEQTVDSDVPIEQNQPICESTSDNDSDVSADSDDSDDDFLDLDDEPESSIASDSSAGIEKSSIASDSFECSTENIQLPSSLDNSNEPKEPDTAVMPSDASKTPISESDSIKHTNKHSATQKHSKPVINDLTSKYKIN